VKWVQTVYRFTLDPAIAHIFYRSSVPKSS